MAWNKIFFFPVFAWNNSYDCIGPNFLEVESEMETFICDWLREGIWGRTVKREWGRIAQENQLSWGVVPLKCSSSLMWNNNLPMHWGQKLSLYSLVSVIGLRVYHPGTSQQKPLLSKGKHPKKDVDMRWFQEPLYQFGDGYIFQITELFKGSNSTHLCVPGGWLIPFGILFISLWNW